MTTALTCRQTEVLRSESSWQLETRFIYKGRLEKDARFAVDNELYYCVWHHRVSTKLASTVAELKRMLVEKTVGYNIVPFDQIYRLCMASKLENLNSRYGSHNDSPVYGTGYRFKINKLSGWVEI